MTRQHRLELKDPAFVWLDVVQPDDPTSSTAIADQYSSTRPRSSDCLDPEHLPKFEAFDQYTFVILRGWDETRRGELRHGAGADPEDRDLLRPGFLITIHRKEQPWLTAPADKARRPRLRGASRNGKEPVAPYLLTKLLNGVLDTYQPPDGGDGDAARPVRGVGVRPARASPPAASAASCGRSTCSSGR